MTTDEPSIEQNPRPWKNYTEKIAFGALKREIDPVKLAEWREKINANILAVTHFTAHGPDCKCLFENRPATMDDLQEAGMLALRQRSESQREREEALLDAAQCSECDEGGNCRCANMDHVDALSEALRAAHRREDALRKWASDELVNETQWQSEVLSILDGYAPESPQLKDGVEFETRINPETGNHEHVMHAKTVAERLADEYLPVPFAGPAPSQHEEGE